ncbi:hypothetical protein MMC11_007305 [Xylographa trunciseda]|nr:hypothetical protein [Xylographa trunciseda]
MAADFWAGYLSGAVGILIGNPLDLVKVQLQAGETAGISSWTRPATLYGRLTSLIRGVAAPVVGYGALNALLFVSYNRTLQLLDPSITDSTQLQETSLFKIWSAGAFGGLATWVVSAPTELIKCRAQLNQEGLSSWLVAKEVWRHGGLRGFYFGGGVTSVRDTVGYGFYFWSYELSKRYMGAEDDSQRRAAMNVLLCGGLAGVVTWASIFPLDVIKTRVQSQATSNLTSLEHRQLLAPQRLAERDIAGARLGALQLAKIAYREGGARVFFQGLGVCSIRAFIVNAVQVCLGRHKSIQITNLSSGRFMNGQYVLYVPYEKHYA